MSTEGENIVTGRGSGQVEPTTQSLEKQPPKPSAQVDTVPSHSGHSAPIYDDGYEVSWDGPSDPASPRNLPVWRKWAVVLINSSTALCVTCTSSLYTSTYGQITVEFGISRLVATLGLSLFIFALGASPMLLGPLSEFFGR
jgi:hypothetical protein